MERQRALGVAILVSLLAGGCRVSVVPGSCLNDADCRDTTREGFDPGKPICNLVARACVGRADGGGHEAGLPEAGLDAGTDIPGDLPHPDVGPFCQGKAGQSCGDDSCAGGMLTKLTCDANATCVPSQKPCDGDTACADAKTCKTSCTVKSDCRAGYHCAGGKCTADLDLGKPCMNKDDCKSGTCTDGVCCTVTDCGTCKQCGTSGSCVSRTAGPAPAGQCTTGEALCGAGLCDGVGNCDYKDKGCAAKTTCPAGGATLTSYVCDASHKCTSSFSSCGSTLCAGGATCPTSCVGHAGCVAGSVCDRGNAHATGAGTCVAPASVLVMTAGQTLLAALNGLGARTHIRTAPSASYLEALNIPASTTVTVIGDGAASIINSAGAAVSIANGSTVTLQGVQLKQSGVGAYCNGGMSVTSTLTLVESTVSNNTGIGITTTNCNVSLYRNTLHNNAGGGVKLDTGTFKLFDNLIRDNGSSASNLGGVSLSAGSVSFVNNTVVSNKALAGNAGGVICTGAYLLKNSILADNGSTQYLGCTLDKSNADNTCALSAAYKPTAAVCLNAGESAAASKLDLENTSRVKGSAVDLGAYEVQ